MEEDAGKLTHVGGADGRIQGATSSLVDYNRAGVPLIEIVTRPIVGAGERAPELARAYVAAIRDIVRSLGISDARMERGNVERAVRYEIRRHAAILERGEQVTQETRHWHEDTRETSSGRPKSDADDYRYFPEPDLVPVVTNSEWIERLRAELPEPPAERRRRLKGEWGYSDEEFRDVVNAGALDVIEETVAAGATAAAARKWWMGEIARRAKQAEVELTALGVEPATVVALEALISEGKINDKIARQVLEFVLAGEGTPAEIVEARGLAVVSDDGALTAAVQEALAAMPDVADKIRAGKVQAAGAIVGQVMKATRGQADAARVRELILAECGVEG